MWCIDTEFVARTNIERKALEPRLAALSREVDETAGLVAAAVVGTEATLSSSRT
jgi:hypothetical protein